MTREESASAQGSYRVICGEAAVRRKPAMGVRASGGLPIMRVNASLSCRAEAVLEGPTARG